MKVKKITILNGEPLFLSNSDISHKETNELDKDKEVEEREKENIDIVAPPSSLYSEDVHGGDEATGDIPDSPNSKNNGESDKEEENIDSSNSEKNPNGNSGGIGGSGESNDHSNDISEGSLDGSGDMGESGNENQEKEMNDENKLPESIEMVEETLLEKLERSEEEESYKTEYLTDSDTDTDTEIADEEIDNNIKQEEEDRQQGSKNKREAFRITEDEYRDNILKDALFRTISRLADDLTVEKEDGDEEWDVQAIMRRSIDKRPLMACRYAKVRERIIIIVDNSGSCENWSELFTSIAQLCSKFELCDIYLAPNFEITKKWNGKKKRYEHIDSINIRDRTVFFFGDFDGAGRICYVSRFCKFYWFSNETRYREFYHHSWNQGVSFKDFKGTYLVAITREDIIKQLKKLRLKN